MSAGSNERMRVLRLAALASSALLGAACLRSTSKIPPPGEGLFVTGVVVARDLTSAEIAGVEGASISVIGSSRTVRTDQRGFFQLERLPLGRHRVFIEREAAGSAPLLRRILDPIDGLVDGQIIDVGQIELSGAGDLAGAVLLDRSPGGPTAGAGALVVATDTVFKAVAGEDGRFLIAGLPEGSVDLVALRPGYVPAHVFGVRVSPGASIQVKDILLRAGPAEDVAVKGSAKLEGQADASGIAVSFIDETDATKIAAMISTGADGAYSATLPAGVYRARFSHDAYCTAEIANVGILPEGVLGLADVVLAPVPASGAIDTCMPMLPPPGADAGVTGSDGSVLPHGARPEIDSIDPLEGAAGSPLMIHGRNFAPDPRLNTVRFGDPGPIVHADSASDTLIVATIPRDARDGLITLFSSTGSVSSAQTFRLKTPPDIFDFGPKAGRISSTVEVLGHGFRVAGLKVFVTGTPAGMAGQIEAGVRTGTSGQALVEQAIIGAQLFDRIRFQIPDGATSGPILVRTQNGSAPSSSPLTVQAGPSIDSISPNPGNIGAQILIVGQGFSTADTGGQVKVQFAGVAAAVDPISVSDTAVLVSVPNGTVSGPIAVMHPAGDAQSPINFIIDQGLPVVQRITPTLVKANGMESITITGLNLESTAMVHFAGNRSAAPSSASAGQVTVTVPAGAQPGPVTLDLTAPSMTSTGSRQRLRILARTDQASCAFCAFLAGLGFSADGDRLFVVSGQDGIVVDAATLDIAAGTTPIAIALPPMSGLSDFEVAPNGRAGLISAYSPMLETYLVDLPSFNVRASCSPPDGSGINSRRKHIYVFDASAEFAYATRPESLESMNSTQDGIFRIDLVSGACDLIGRRTIPASQRAYSAIANAGPGQLFVADYTQGLAIMDADARSPLLGMLLTPFQGIGYSDAVQIFVGPRSAYILSVGIGGALRYTPFSAAAPSPVPYGGGGGQAFQSADHRWLVYNSSIVDLELAETVRTEAGLSGATFGAAHPTRNTFVADGSGRLSRIDILE
jgi:IPT/TIG domain-containing protein